MSGSLWDAMERLRIGAISGLDRIDALVQETKSATPDHECPWVGPCGCLRDGSLCGCTHQHGEHGEPSDDYYGPCTRCKCEWFTPVHDAGEVA